MNRLQNQYPQLFRSIYRQGSLPVKGKEFEIGVLCDLADPRRFSLRVMGTGFYKTYGTSPGNLDGIGTYLQITRGIRFMGDISVVTPIDIMEHCALQNVMMVGRRWSLCLQ